ncbi:hypothetical protein [Neomoorella thermoacetica]|uniref:RNA polymerase sigma factor n=1 Tax=Neomoorella thermoacetica TaxID=1525 RepID=A0A1D7XBQ0_NEOTH|nr:hypothetical protein [Moorella thermoacetica]AKX94408.1 RNA polymerase sigma factor RpoD [Moorella thermoacetica]AKX97044.1 RNA polymerase sigma factor RpoD [Moorella thermoacetica]AOQ24347.1 RNA polymerase sigma factor [Moorella thermoacetica]OIQ08466.1 RNA polymerase sigma factor RpoD [Moorella thermoacetica]OIQ10372.1 RNA polymerase sigma factor RpoD [Moorella thermoacetica]
MDELKPPTISFIKKEKISELLNYFTQEEADILRMRYGIGQPAMPIYKIAKVKNMSVTQTKLLIRDIEKKLIKQLRTSR